MQAQSCEARLCVRQMHSGAATAWSYAALPFAVGACAATCHRGGLVFAGGEASSCASDRVFAYSEASSMSESPFTALPTLSRGRITLGLHSVVDNDHALFALGGRGPKALASVECLRADSAEWRTDIPSMESARFSFASSVVSDGCLHVAGGVGSNDVPFERHERFDAAAGRWLSCCALPHSLSGLGSATLCGALAVCGGFSLRGPVASCVLYDCRSDSWIRRADMLAFRTAHACVTLDDQLFALGGVPLWGQEEHSVEVYDSRADRWSGATFALPAKLIGFAAALVE
jgi:hypothetical protein